MISEVDINDWERGEPVPLYSVPNKTYIDVDGVKLFFDHLDGMYSYCLDLNNNVYHIAAFEIVIPLVKPEKV